MTPDKLWPRSLLGLPVAAVTFGIQALPVIGIAGDLLQYVPGMVLYATAFGIGYEVVAGRATWGWMALPFAFAVLVMTVRLFERPGIEAERAWLAAHDAVAPGPGRAGLPVRVDQPETARALAKHYDVDIVYAKRDATSVDFVAYRPGSQADQEPERSSVPEEPSGTLTVFSSSVTFKRGLLEGYRNMLTAEWPGGRKRARIGAELTRIGIPAFPLAGCPTGPWLAAGACRIGWLRPVSQDLGYRTNVDSEHQADDIARLIGLRRRTSGRPS